MRNTIQIRSNPVGDAVFNASRQVWLASLGAAVVTREWAQADAGKMFRNLVKEGTAVESRTFRVVGDRLRCVRQQFAGVAAARGRSKDLRRQRRDVGLRRLLHPGDQFLRIAQLQGP